MRPHLNIHLLFCFLLNFNIFFSQSADSSFIKKTFTNLAEAKINPLNVYRLNLSGLPIDSFPVDLSKFKNLEYLCLNNDHLEFIPREIGDLQNLKVLQLNGDDFKTLPGEFSKLKNLEEVHLNFDKKMDLRKSISVLNTLPKLLTLHLEGDGIKTLPANFGSLVNLQNLYLNNNKFNEIPLEIKGMKNLKYLDLRQNNIPSYKFNDYKPFGLTIKF